jgi:hypothetical protein
MSELITVIVRPWRVHSRESLCDLLEQCLHIVPCLGASFDKHNIKLLGLFFSLFCRNLTLIRQIGLVADQDNNNILAPFCSNVVNPLASVLERIGILVIRRY